MASRLNQLNRYIFEKNYTRFSVLYFFALILLIFLIPFFLSEFNLTRLYYRIYLSAFILLSTLVSQHNKKFTYIMAMFTVVIVNIIHLDEPDDYLLLFRVSAMSIYFVIILHNIMNDILKSLISIRILIQAINGYLLIGLIFGEIYKMIHLINPDAFNFVADDLYDHFYMSFVILSSVGLGDLLPTSPAAKSLVMLNGVCGQIYSVFFASVIIGKFLSNKSDS